ncbi:MAG TPA: hypothetical protein VOA88_10920 [Candidatus Dormibacteraeota bacterium]|nr:hypothetical protein [Candidatus Dormibacteraeota bacterium]
MNFVMLTKEDGSEVSVNPAHVLSAESNGRGTRVHVDPEIRKVLEMEADDSLYSSLELFAFNSRLNR